VAGPARRPGGGGARGRGVDFGGDRGALQMSADVDAPPRSATSGRCPVRWMATHGRARHRRPAGESPGDRRDRRRAVAQGAVGRAAHAGVRAGHVLFAVTTFVVFHFALNRNTIDGVSRRESCVTAPVRRDPWHQRLFRGGRRSGGFDGFLLAPVNRSAMLLAKVLALLATGGARARGGAGLLAAAAGPPRSGRRLPGLLWVLVLGDIGVAVIGTLVARAGVRNARRGSTRAALALRCSCRGHRLRRASSPLFSVAHATGSRRRGC